MATWDVGRNDPCPCGSGKKKRKCCPGRDTSGFSLSGSADVFEESWQMLENRQFDSSAQARDFARDSTEQSSQAEIDRFQGLSSQQMHRLLYFPFESPQTVMFPEHLGQTPDAPVLSLFRMLAEAIDENSLKPTAKGNLPRKVCQETALKYLGDDCYRDRTLFGGMNKEEDFAELNVVRIVSEQAGLIRKYKGRFILGRKCRELLAKSGFDLIYTQLFRAYVEKFNWEYRDPYLKIDIIQRAFLFSLYLLMRYGDHPLCQSFYEDCFLRAFPTVMDQVESDSDFTPEQLVSTSYTQRTLIDFLEFFGLAKAQPLLTERTYGQDYRVSKLPLLEKVVHFYLV